MCVCYIFARTYRQKKRDAIYKHQSYCKCREHLDVAISCKNTGNITSTNMAELSNFRGATGSFATKDATGNQLSPVENLNVSS